MLLYIAVAIFTIFVIRKMFKPKVPDGSPPLVQLKSGKVEGQLLYSTNGRVFSSFNGIPFAKPPVGKLRFRRPEPVDKVKWKCMINGSSMEEVC